MEAIAGHERGLTEAFLSAVQSIDGVTVYGPTVTGANRTPTFAVDVAGLTAGEVERALGERGIFVWSGHYYAVEVMRRLGVLEAGGLVRIGFVHYNTSEELARVVEALDDLARSGT
jgi:selenocysteine lyase/cysteine desulfurase